MIVFLDEAYDSLLVQELELEKIYDEKIITIDTMSIDSARSIFSERYGFINMLHPTQLRMIAQDLERRHFMTKK